MAREPPARDSAKRSGARWPRSKGIGPRELPRSMSSRRDDLRVVVYDLDTIARNIIGSSCPGFSRRPEKRGNDEEIVMSAETKPRAACLIGWPAAHSRSPLIHHYWLRALAIEGGYTIESVPPEDFADFVGYLAHHGFV